MNNNKQKNKNKKQKQPVSENRYRHAYNDGEWLEECVKFTNETRQLCYLNALL